MRSMTILRNVSANATTGFTDDIDVPSWALYAIFYINLTAVAGTTPLFDFKLQWIDPVDNTTVEDFPGAGITQLTGADFIVYMVGAPGLADDDTGPVYTTAFPLPPTIRAVTTTDRGTGDETYTYTQAVVFVG